MDKELQNKLIDLLNLCLEWMEMEIEFPITGADFAPPIKKVSEMIQELNEL